MSYFMFDIEADGPIPGDYSMISLGAVLVDAELDKQFYREVKPISEKYIDQALSVSGFTRDETLSFDDPESVLKELKAWILENSRGRPVFISDNNGFDWMFVCWYFQHFLGENPFGYSSQNLGSLYKGLVKDCKKNFKHLRKGNLSHNALQDAIDNAEVLLKLSDQIKGIK